MIWQKTTGNKAIQEKLQESVKNGRVSHAQLFIGNCGWGIFEMALNYAAAIMAAEKGEIASRKVLDMQHPDVHFSFPVTSGKETKPTSKMYLKQWREFMLQNPFGNLFDWQVYSEVETKQGRINVAEAEEIERFLALKSYEGGYKVCIIWLPENLHPSASNKLLKSIEEPPEKTVFLLLTEQENMLLPTILSRCQAVKFNRLSISEITDYLIKNKGLQSKDANHIAMISNGDMRTALKNAETSGNEFEAFFVQWVRHAFMAKKNPAVLKNLIAWSAEIGGWSREKQKQFLIYCSEIFRQSLMKSYQVDSLAFMQLDTEGFKWEKFAPFIHGANIEAILEKINEGVFHIERNANAKILFLDLSIKLTRYLHMKPVMH